MLATLQCMRQEIEALLSRSAAAWSAGDLDAFMECYEDAPDTVYLSSTQFVSGYAAIRAMYAERFGRTMEWDTAAPQAILEAAGGRVVTTDGAKLRYAKPGWENPHFICWGR